MHSNFKKLAVTFLLLLPILSIAGTNLPAIEESLLLKEINRMRETNEENVVEFSSKIITPENIKAFIAQPKFGAYDNMIRSNALIFAAQTDLLTFEKFSDIQQKMSTWFPAETNGARTGKDSFFNKIIFLGPYSNWPVESMAFGALWECMPRSTWIHPQKNPYGYGLQLTDGSGDFRFIKCFESRVGRIHVAEGDALYKKSLLEKKTIQELVAPYLENRFEQHLKKYQCKLTGADDCVLVLSMWAALNPKNKKLGQFIPLIESQLAAVKGNIETDSKPRKMAFLQAKMLYQLIQQQDITDELAQAIRINQSVINSNPNLDLRYFANFSTSIHSEFYRQVTILLASNNCNLINSQIPSKDVEWDFVLKAMTKTGKLPCNYYLDTRALFDDDNKNDALKKAYLAIILKEGAVKEREAYISDFLSHGDDCFSARANQLSLENKQLCKRYVHEKETTEFGRMKITNNKSLLKTIVKIDSGRKETFKSSSWVYQRFLPVLGKSTSLKLKNLVRDYTSGEPKTYLAEISVWQDLNHGDVLLHMYFYVGNSSAERWMVANKNGLQDIQMPGRFKIRSQIEVNDIVKVTDLDSDGNLELWIHDQENIVAANIFSEHRSYTGDEHYRFDECKGNETDLKRNIDCTLPLARMGEINQGMLTYFAKNKPINTTPISHLFKGDKDYPAYDYAPRYCNELLIRAAIASKFTLKTDAEVLGLACEENQMHPERHLISFFHTMTENDFKLALIDVDVKNKKIYHQYNRTIESDAITNPQNGGIAIDFIDVAENKKAIKVTLNINRSPRCAEANENNLMSLLIEDKNSYRPILQDMVMYRWQLTSGDPCSANEDVEYTDENIYIELQPTISEHNELKDFDVVHKRKINAFSETRKPEYKEERAGSLEFNGKEYQLIKN